MGMSIERKIVLAFLCTLLFTSSAFSRISRYAVNAKERTRSMAAVKANCMAAHRVGKIVLAVNNNGTFGKGFRAGADQDCFTGQSVPSCEYPKGSTLEYLFAGAFWIGAVKGRDTLVSVGADGWELCEEFFPPDQDQADLFGTGMQYRSIIDPSAPAYDGAISEEDYISTYSDTTIVGVCPDFFNSRPHRPLYINVTERSFAWSYSYAEDFVLFDYAIRNIGNDVLHQVFMGIYVDADVGFDCFNQGGQCAQDDLCGFVHALPSPTGCGFVDTVNIAWTADADGDYHFTGAGQSQPHPATSVTATRIVRTPADSLEVSFNWWVSNQSPTLDYGPRERTKNRDFRTGGLGTPEGDVNKYFLLSNGEFDFDQAFVATIQPTDTLWAYPPQDQVDNWATGLDTRYLLSFGPFDISPGQTLPISFAYVAGENFHHDPDNAANNLPNNPEAYYQNLSFVDLGVNANWASWIYDNPGVDTDGDGYKGKVRYCNLDSVFARTDTTIAGNDTLIDTVWDYTQVDTIYYEGDGVPDFRGASPPPAPTFWLEPSLGKIKVRFNGLRSETTKDVFSHVIDFEGYRIYVGRDARAGSYSVVESYDIEDYNKYVYNPRRVGGPGFELLEKPFTLQELRCLYGKSCDDETFNPEAYTVNNPFRLPGTDSLFYFTPQDYNVSRLGIDTKIVKRFPDQPYPSNLNPDSANADELTDDGYLKYFEYEYEITDLLSTVPYYVNVTAFDFGSPESGLPSLETSVTIGAKSAYPTLTQVDNPNKPLKVYIYPNPYRFDADYRDAGYEGLAQPNIASDRLRRINFANLPPQCTIRIYTLDGDLVRQIDHNVDASSALSSHDTWDLITRNTQLAVSGLYYWTVETPDGRTQIGKLVLIM